MEELMSLRSSMKVLITGSNGFIGQNLKFHFSRRDDIVVVPFTRNNDITELPALLCDVDLFFISQAPIVPKIQ